MLDATRHPIAVGTVGRRDAVELRDPWREQRSQCDHPRRRPGRPKGGQIVADRATILAAAVSVIRRQGPDATMDDIAAGASVTKPILYRTIGDKAALMNALSESLVDEIDRAVAAGTKREGDPRRAFESAIRCYVEAVEAERNLFLFVNAVLPAPTRSAASSTDRRRR